MSRRPLCFVLMPYDRKRDSLSGEVVDFNAIYNRFIAPAITDAGLRPFRQDEELKGGIFHKHLFERLTLCEYAIADLSHANANVFYELGIRHARRPWSTVLIHRRGSPLPLDVAMDSSLGYPIDLLERPAEVARMQEQLTRRLLTARERATDSPFFQLVNGVPVPEVDHRRVDAMLESVDRQDEANVQINSAKRDGIDALRRTGATLADRVKDDPEVAVNLLLAFRAHQAWSDMIDLVGSMTSLLSETLLVREQYALALGRTGSWAEAEEILTEIVDRRPSSETYGLLGGMFKRQWLEAADQGRRVRAEALLESAEEQYRRGFEADWRDPYPGVNAITLRAVRGVLDDDFNELLHVVRYSVRRRLAAAHPEYWDHASSLQLAVIAGNRERATGALRGMITTAKESFEIATTLEGLTLLTEFCRRRGDSEWLDELIQEIDDLGAEMSRRSGGVSRGERATGWAK